MEKFQPPRGTRDFLPDEMAARRALCEKIRKVFEAYGYGEVCTPAFEDFALLEKKSGPQIEDEIYAFTDKGGRKLGLRFDPTVPICRIVASNPALQKPVKFYYITNMWRYDNPGAGRWREFWQAGVELIGPAGPEADAEMLALVSDCIRAAGIKDFTIRVNSRVFVEGFLEDAKVPKALWPEMMRSLDKTLKLGVEGVKEELRRKGIDKEYIEAFMKYARSSVPKGPAWSDGGAKNVKGKSNIDDIVRIQKLAGKMGAGRIEIDLSIVRGIDYYTGFVFETYVKGFEGMGSVAGGGRYDGLIGLYSGRDTPATGFGMGIDRLMEIVGKGGTPPAPKVFVIQVSEKTRGHALEITQMLRRSGVSADTDLMGRDLRKQMEYAGKRGVPFALIVGPREAESGRYTLRDMKTGKEELLTPEGVLRKLAGRQGPRP